jgi:DNA repair protein RadC
MSGDTPSRDPSGLDDISLSTTKQTETTSWSATSVDASLPFGDAATSVPSQHKAKTEQPHYTGHRQRLRQKLLDHGAAHFADYELLELLLMLAIPRRDVKPLAKDLLAHFGDFAGVITARTEDLMAFPGVKDTTVAALKTVEGAAVRMLKSKVQDQPVLAAWDTLMDYCLAVQSRSDVEEFRVLYLDTKKRLITDEAMQRGTINHTPVYTREVVRRALELHAHSVIMVHNHPSGDPTPSRADVDTTLQMKMALQTVDIILHDHVIVSPGRYISLRQKKLI